MEPVTTIIFLTSWLFVTKFKSFLAILFSKKENGKPVINGTEYVIENKEGFDKELSTLKETYADAISIREKQLKEYNELLETEADNLEFYKISINDIPKEISVKQMVGIYPIISEEVKASSK